MTTYRLESGARTISWNIRLVQSREQWTKLLKKRKGEEKSPKLLIDWSSWKSLRSTENKRCRRRLPSSMRNVKERNKSSRRRETKRQSTTNILRNSAKSSQVIPKRKWKRNKRKKNKKLRSKRKKRKRRKRNRKSTKQRRELLQLTKKRNETLRNF